MTTGHPDHAPQVGRGHQGHRHRDDRGPLPPAERLGDAERREHVASHTGEYYLAGPGPVSCSVVVKLAVARTVPFIVVSRAPVTWLAAIGSGLPQAP